MSIGGFTVRRAARQLSGNSEPYDIVCHATLPGQLYVTAEQRVEIKINAYSHHEVSSSASEYYSEYWTDGVSVSQGAENLSRWILDSYLPGIKNKHIVEVGIGGEGGLSRLLAAENTVYGVDISRSAVRNCAEMGLDVQLCDLSSDKIALPDASVDVVIGLEVFEHFANPQAALEELWRILKAEGTLLISTPTPWSYHWPRLFYPAQYWSKEAVSDFLVANKFELIRCDDGAVPCNTRRNIPEKYKVWNWIFQAEKISDDNADGLFEAGLYFWEKMNEHGVRLFPIEAIDFFRKCWQLTGSDSSLLFLGRALLYRLLSGELTEFSNIFEKIRQRNNTIQGNGKEMWDQGVAMLLLEAELIGVPLSPIISEVRSFVASRQKLVEECRRLGIVW